jgi:hypothetical protein
VDVPHYASPAHFCSQTSSSLFCPPPPFPVAASNRADQRAVFTESALGGEEREGRGTAAATSARSSAPNPGAFSLLINAVSCLSELLCRH